MLLNISILVLIFFVLFFIPFIVWIHSPANRVASADEYYLDGNIEKAEEVLMKVWTRRYDVPAHLAEIYFKQVKAGELEYATKAFSLPTDDLHEDAVDNLKKVQNKIRNYIEDKANKAFSKKDYDVAIKYNQVLLTLGEKYKTIDETYRTHRELSFASVSK